MSNTFGPAYFKKIPKYGVGLGLNPSDARRLYVEEAPGLIDFFEVTVASSRDQGSVNYTDVRRKHAATDGGHYLRIDDYPREIKRLVHSTNVNPVYPEPIGDEAVRELRRLVEAVDSPWVTEDLGVWLMSERHVYPFFMPLPLTQEALAVTIHNVRMFQAKVGVPFNAEFPPVRVIAGEMHAFDFFRVLVEETGCGLCLDLGHVLSYQLERHSSPTADLHLLPWDSVTELHVSGGNIDLASDGLHYDDKHGDYEIVTVCYDLMDAAIRLSPNLKAVTLEIFGARQPESVLKKLKKIRARRSVADWLCDLKGESISLPSLETAQRKVRESVVAMYDVLHGADSLSGELLEKSGSAFLRMFASGEQRKWEYERQSRLQLQGLNLSEFYPLTTQWLVRSGEYANHEALFARMLDGLPGTMVSMNEKVKDLFGAITEESGHPITKELYRCETWMNECARGTNGEEVLHFSVDVWKLMKDINRGVPLEEGAAYRTPFTLRHLGECRFSRIQDEDFHSAEDLKVLGESSCCTGK